MHMMFGVIIEKLVLVFKEVSGGFQGSTEVWDASHGVRGGLGRLKKLRSEPLVSYSDDFLSKRLRISSSSSELPFSET